MKKELKCATFEQSVELKELGLVQFQCDKVWHHVPNTGFKILIDVGIDDSIQSGTDVIAAPDLSELGIMLGENFMFNTTSKNQYETSVSKKHINHPVIKEGHNFVGITSDTSEAESRAGMILDLLRLKLISIEDINARLCKD